MQPKRWRYLLGRSLVFVSFRMLCYTLHEGRLQVWRKTKKAVPSYEWSSYKNQIVPGTWYTHKLTLLFTI